MDQLILRIDNLTPQVDYSLQLIFYAGGYNHGFDVMMNGELIYDDLNLNGLRGYGRVDLPWQGPGLNRDAGVFVRVDFVAADSTVTIDLDPSDVPLSMGVAPAILSAFTLERAPASSVTHGDSLQLSALRLVDVP